jgi:hypothetical protein
MDEKDAAEHAKDLLGAEEARYDDPSESIKWQNHTEEEETVMKDCTNYVRGYIDELEIQLEPGHNQLISHPLVGCERHNGMCVSLNPNNPKMAALYENPTIKFREEERPLVEGIGVLAKEIVSQNQQFVDYEQDIRYQAEFHLVVARP